MGDDEAADGQELNPASGEQASPEDTARVRARRGCSQAASGVPALHTPADVAHALGCSEWWVKEQARKRRIPFTWIGGSYRFTDEHLAEIIRTFEYRPNPAPGEHAPSHRAPTQRQARTRRSPRCESAPLTRLQARPPHRHHPTEPPPE